ncbi:MAG: T9SS type A sorting domain-containing protein [Bacteroidaceae bacterium]|nr:T9SS type A sorting domain-containing protein [Bacteroidaceae bacterium]
MMLSILKGKRLSALIIALLGCLPDFAGTSLQIHLTDGTEVVCSLDKEPRMEFSENTITLSALEGRVGQWDFTDVESWSFVEVDAIDAIPQKKDQIKIEKGKLTIVCSSADKVAVYDLSGRRVNPSLRTVGHTTTVGLNGFTAGTYVLRVGGSSIKFMVR